MKINARLVNKKRHTVGYMVGSTHRDRKTTISMARRGAVNGVKVCGKGSGAYLVSEGSTAILDLPEKIVTCQKTLSCRSRNR